MTRHC